MVYVTGIREYDIMKTKLKKADIIMIACCLAASVLFALVFALGHNAGDTVHIIYDGTELKSVPLYGTGDDGVSETDGYYLVTYHGNAARVEYFDCEPALKSAEDSGYNLIRIAGGRASVIAADCKDQICVHHKPIAGDRESIICLPHRLVLEISAGESKGTSGDALDGVVR